MKIESTQSKIVSLKSIHDRKADLNSHRRMLLDKVSQIGEYSFFMKGHVTVEDLAYLTAYSGCEFALLTGKSDDILFHGDKYSCQFDAFISELLKKHKYSLYAHSHPDEDEPEPSIADRNTLSIIKQDSSQIISATTLRITKFSYNQCLDYLL